MAFSGGHPVSSFMIKKDVNLKPFNTLGVASKAHSFIEVTNENQLMELVGKGVFNGENPVILGGGSNILIRKDPSKPVLKVTLPGITIVEEDQEYISVKVGAGVIWHDLVRWAVENGYGGIENLALIPGTVGAAPIQNIGAYGVELEQVFLCLDYFDMEHHIIKTAGKKECEFGYRESIFKRELKGKVIVLSVTLRLNKSPHQVVTDYYALKEWMEEKNIKSPTIKNIYDAVISIRTSKLPDPSLIGNAGSFFKNPIVGKSVFEKIKAQHSDMPSYPVDDALIKIPAGWLIEKAGWKGKRVGNVGTYKNQALVIVNHGNATGDEIYRHAMRIQKSVKQMFGVELAPEVNIIE